MNSMHNSFSGPGGYPSGYPGYVPPPSALPYYNGYPSELNPGSNPYYAKPGAPVPQTYPSNNYSGPMNNSSVYYQQYGLGYQYGYGKYGIGYSEPGIHPSSIGALQNPTTDLGLTGSMFSKTKYSAAPATNASSTSTPATTSINTSSLLSPATSNTPSPGPHGLSVPLKCPEATPSPPVETNDGKKDIEKMKRCQVCGQVFRLMSECLAHMKAAHETPHSVYNLSHHGGCGPSGSSGPTMSSPISTPRHMGMSTPDSPLMALERMGWGEKQGIVPHQSASSPMPTPYPQSGQQNHQVCVPHPQPGVVYGGHPITRLSSSSQHPIGSQGMPSGFSVQQSSGANVSPALSDTNPYSGSSESNAMGDDVSKSKKNTCYSMSSIIGEKPLKAEAKFQIPPNMPSSISGAVNTETPLPEEPSDQAAETDQGGSFVKSEDYESSHEVQTNEEIVSEKKEEELETNLTKNDPNVKIKGGATIPAVPDKSISEKESCVDDPCKEESQTEKITSDSGKVTDLEQASPMNQSSQGSLDSSPNVQVLSESTGSQTNFPTSLYPIQKHPGYNHWPAGMNTNVSTPYNYTQEVASSYTSAVCTTTPSSVGSVNSGYPGALQRFPSTYTSTNSSSGFGTPEHLIRPQSSNALSHQQATGWFPGSRNEPKQPWGNWNNANNQPYGMYGYPAGVNSKSTGTTGSSGHHSSQSSFVQGMTSNKASVQPPNSFPANHSGAVHSFKGSPGATVLQERPDKEGLNSPVEIPYKMMHKPPTARTSTGIGRKNNRIGPKSKIRSLKHKSQPEEIEQTKIWQNSQNVQGFTAQCDVQSSDCSDCDSQIGNVPKLTLLKPKRRGSLGKDGVFVGPKRVKIAYQVKERQRKRHKELQEQIRQCEMEEQMLAQKIEEADDQQSPLANVLLQSSILLSDTKVDASDLVQQSIASIKAESNCGLDEASSDRESHKFSMSNGNLQQRSFPKKMSKLGHPDNSVVIKDFHRPRHSKKLRAKDFKWGQYVKNNRYWCGDCAHGFKNQKETTTHTEERCKANCLYMLECYVIVKDIHSHPFYGQKVQELLEEYQVDGQHHCNTCGEIFEKKSDYLVHVDSHKDFMPWECTICGTRFKIRGSLKEHLRYTHMKGRVPCLKCNKVFPTSTLLRQHVKVHTQHYKYKSGKNREEELRAAMEATAGALEPSVASPEENDRLSSQEANEYRSWCRLMEINAMKNIATTGASVAGVNLQLEEDDDDRNDGDSLSGEDIGGSHLDYHTLDGRGMMHS